MNKLVLTYISLFLRILVSSEHGYGEKKLHVLTLI